MPDILMLGVDCFQIPETLIQTTACFQIPETLIHTVLEGVGIEYIDGVLILSIYTPPLAVPTALAST